MQRQRILVAALMGLSWVSPLWAASDSGHEVDAMALYSQGQAVVQDQRKVKLDKGKQSLDWPVVGAIQPDSFGLTGSQVTLLGFDLAADQGMPGKSPLASRIGSKVVLKDAEDRGRQGRLVAVDNQTAYVRVDDEIEQVGVNGPTRIAWPATESEHGNALQLHVQSGTKGKRRLTATYQTSAPSWKASYTGYFDADRQQLKLSAQALIDNSGEHELRARQAWLATGSSDHSGGVQLMTMARSAKSETDMAGRAEAVGDQYRYPLPHGLQVPAGRIQSVTLIKPFKRAASRHYRVENQALHDGGETRRPAQVALHWRNGDKMPLPAGVARIYAAGHKAQLLAASHLKDTPAGAPVRLSLGRAFDVTATHQVTDRTRTDEGGQQMEVTVKLFNAGQHDKRVTVVEQLPNRAQLDKDSPQPGAGSASKPAWRTTVPAGGDKTLVYRLTMPPAGS